MPFTFKGGIHIDEHKNTRKAHIRRMPAPDVVSIPLSQHIGAHCTPVVDKGDTVLRGQIIGTVEKGLGCPVHSSVSGVVKDIAVRHTATGMPVRTVVIENDGQNTLSPDIKPYGKSLLDASAEEIISVVKNAGIVGMGGAGFPAYAKIESALGKVDKLIINCAECEPYITANHRLMLENPAAIVNGTKVLLKALGITEAVIAIEDNKLDAANKFEELLVNDEMIKVKVLPTKYPQGDERQLIYVITGKQLPVGKLPADAGCVIFNAETAACIYSAFAHGMPVIERTVTVDGDCVKMPKNVLVPIGTSLYDLIEFCGGLKKNPKKIINGGPMMGQAIWDITSPVTKTTSAVLVFSEERAPKPKEHYSCIRCGMCVSACPMHLMPLYLAAFSQKNDMEKCAEFDIMSCVECGCCTYVCPGGVPIVQHIRTAKGKIKEAQMAKNAAEAQTKKEENK